MDLNIDLVPDRTDQDTLWGPALPDLIFARQRTYSWNQLNGARKITDTEYYNNVPYACPREDRLFKVLSSVSTFDDYVDSLIPSGNPYTDSVLLWVDRKRA